jgi:hypothetical protein
MSETVKIDAVTALPSKSKYRKYAPVIIISCGIFIVIVVAYHKYSSSSTDPLSDSELAFTDTFGESYGGGGGLDKLYDKIGGSESLNNGNLSSQIDVDTENYSCSFDVTYQGDKKKRVECRSGCFIDDDNSKFCEKYIYNSRVDGGGSLDTIYDDAGGNESGSISRMISKINVDAGDKTCGFYVDYEGNNKRTVDVDEGGSPSPICNKFAYGDGDPGDLWETLIDDTYISGRRDLDRANKDADDHDLPTPPPPPTPSGHPPPPPGPSGHPPPPPPPPSDDGSAPVIIIFLTVVVLIILGVIGQNIPRYNLSSENIIGMWSFIFVVSFSLFVGSIDGMISPGSSVAGWATVVLLNILAIAITVSISIMGGKSLQRGLHFGDSAMAPIGFGVLGLMAFIISFIVV